MNLKGKQMFPFCFDYFNVKDSEITQFTLKYKPPMQLFCILNKYSDLFTEIW